MNLFSNALKFTPRGKVEIIAKYVKGESELNHKEIE